MLAEKVKRFVSILLLTLAVIAVQGQQSNLTEEDVIARAEAFFEQENWGEALPLFAQLVSVHPEKPEYNYKFGVCTLMGNRSDKRRPVRYLSLAYRSMPDNKDLLYYLGLAYYQNEEFANAMKYFNLYLAKLDAKSPDRARILEQVNACLNGMNLEHKNLVNEVLSKDEFQQDNFHRAYRADELDGSLVLKPENFMSQQEKSSGENSFVYVSEPRGVLFYSGYADNGSKQRDIFKVTLKDNGKWGDPEALSDKVNTAFDEDYPVVSDQGSTLYFSSKGHNSVGGYDVFKSTLDPQTQEFGIPENMGKGINSPFDDVLFIPDNSGSGAYFASNRDNLGDNISVYRIRLSQEGFADQQILAQQSIQTKIEGAVSDGSSTSVASNQQADNRNAQVAAARPEVDPAKKAADLVQQRNYVNKLADTAYLLVSEMKNLIRDLTNKRDRANMISDGKMDKAKSLEAEYEHIVSGLPAAADKDAFEAELAKAVKIKEEIYQYRQRADQSNLIAWNIGKQIKIKNEELKQLKLDAGEVQSLSVRGEYDQTKLVYTRLKSSYLAADTLADFAENINWINADKVEFKVPDEELAFADKMREGYENQTLLAMTQAQQGAMAKFDESVPINIVDNRTSARQPDVPAVVVAKQVETVSAASLAQAGSPDVEEELEIGFGVDAIEPVPLVVPVVTPAFVFSDPVQEEETLEIDFHADAIQPELLVDPVQYEKPAIALEENEELEINFNADRIEAEPLISPVAFDQTAFAVNLDEEELEVNERVDRIEPEKAVQPVNINEVVIAFEENEELEINFNADRIEAKPLISPIAFEQTAFAVNLDEEELEVNERVDWIEPEKVIQPVNINEVAIAFEAEDEDLEINNRIDWVEAEDVVQPVIFNADAIAFEDDPALEIDNRIDRVDAKALVQPVMINEGVIAFVPENEELEIDHRIDRIEAAAVVQPVVMDETALAFDEAEEALEISSQVDWMEAEAVIQPVVFNEKAVAAIPEDEELEVGTTVDRIVPEDVIEPVVYSTQQLAMDEEVLELDSRVDAIVPEHVVVPVEYQETVAFSLPGEEPLELGGDLARVMKLVKPVAYTDGWSAEDIREDLEISFDADMVQPEAQVEPVVFANVTTPQPVPEEELEIRLENESVMPEPQVAEINVQAIDAGKLEALEEELDVNFGVDAMEAYVQVEPVRVTDQEAEINEELEIRVEQDMKPAVEVLAVVEPVHFSGSEEAYGLAAESLEIDFAIDKPVAVEPENQVEPVKYSLVAYSLEDIDELLEISFHIDAEQQDNLMADNAAISSMDMAGVPGMPAAGTELFYLRESLSMAADIETSRTDMELVRIAIENPEDLSYEELLFAASLASIPEDKLKIYNYAFIHIDRDWRAFNNAAVTAMNMKDLDQAEVYLYQASLISTDNGKVENNMGILACYKNDFLSAESHFIAASQLGVNSEYNLQLIKNLVNKNRNKTN